MAIDVKKAKGKTKKSETSSEKNNKEKALDLALSTIEKQFGKGAIMRLDKDRDITVPCVTTGVMGIDLALGGKGTPIGRMIEIYGPESSGKTTLTLQVASEFQKLGKTVAFIDAEHALDTEYATKLGVNIPNLLISQPDSGEQALEIADMLVRSGAVDLVIIDSVAALTPRAELEGDMGQSHMGLQARLMSQALRKLTGTISKTNCTVIFINQLRMKIGVMFGNPETTTGGNALKFYCSVRMDIRRVGSIKNGDEVIGNKTRIKIVKNKIAAPFKVWEGDIIFGEGFDKIGDLLDLAVAHKIVDKSGAWFSYDGAKLGQGRENSKQTISENSDIKEKLYKEVLEAINGDSGGSKPEMEPSNNESDDQGMEVNVSMS
ncbi:MAG: recombinase RecA [Oligoflexia bacterium]|nr:recombinase RecA [Oligoflexia bacterium]